MGSNKINTCDRNTTDNYIFYGSEGNPINILYDDVLKKYNGKLYFPENSSDTFKELELNIFEKINGFEYKQYISSTVSEFESNELKTKKFQLFNTHGISLVNNNEKCLISKIEATNNDNNYKSKWVYGDNIDLKFPHGTEIIFNKNIFSINSDETYTVVNHKQGAILIITQQDNKTFNNTIGGSIYDLTNYENLYISGVNAIKIKDYITSDYKNNFPSWSEPNFYNDIYNGQKLSIINSLYNDGVYTVKSESLGDNFYKIFRMNLEDFDGDLDLVILNKTYRFNIYSQKLIFESVNNIITFENIIPSLLKPNTEFIVPNSINNNVLKVSDILYFDISLNITYNDSTTSPSGLPDQIYYNNNIYECVKSYVNDNNNLSNITPDNTEYWKLSNFIMVDNVLSDEILLKSELFLNDNEITLKYKYDSSLNSIENIFNFVRLYSNEFDLTGVDYKIDNLGYYIDIICKYPTDYIDIKYNIHKIDSFDNVITDGTNYSPTNCLFKYEPFNVSVKLNGNVVPLTDDYLDVYDFGYFSDNGPSDSQDLNELNLTSEFYWKSLNSNYDIISGDIIEFIYTTNVTKSKEKIERIIEIDNDDNDNFKNEDNTNFSEIQERILIIDDIDEYGLNININGEEYYIESTLIYQNNGNLNNRESIHNTINQWVKKWKYELDIRGILISPNNFKISDINQNVFNDSILIKSVYPNVEIDINVYNSETSLYKFIDKQIIFYKLGGDSSILDININNISYTIDYEIDVKTTLSKWVNLYENDLYSRGIIIENIRNNIFFYKLENIDIDVNIKIGKYYRNNSDLYEIVKYWRGNPGMIISSNRILQNNTDVSFEDECFSTGQIISLNNSEWVLNNQEYNILKVNPNELTLSYQGPFWGTIDNSVQNAFFELSFGDGLEVDQKVISIVDGSYVTGTILSYSNTNYQILYNGTQIATIPRTNAWYYDDMADNGSWVMSLSSDIKYNQIEETPNNIFIYNTLYHSIVITDSNIYFKDLNDDRTIKVISLNNIIIKVISNPVNKLIYLISENELIVVEPYTMNIIYNSYVWAPSIHAFDICCDINRGDIYISFSDSDVISKIDKDLSFISSLPYNPGFNYNKMKYNINDDKLYVFGRVNMDITINSDKYIYRIDLENNIKDNSFNMSGSLVDNVGSSNSYLGGSLYLGGEIQYNDFNGDLYISNGNMLHKIDTTNEILIDLQIDISTYYSISKDINNKFFWISSNNKLTYISENNNINDIDISDYGYLIYNNIDSNLYLSSSSTNKLYVFSTYYNQIFYTFDLNYKLDYIKLDSLNNKIKGISIINDDIVNIPIEFIYYQLKSFSSIFNQITYKPNILDSRNTFGILSDDYNKYPFMYINSSTFLRKPRKNYNTGFSNNVKWEIKWENDNKDELFLYDISGDYLADSGSYSYIGEKPLSNPILRKIPNNNIDYISDSSKQQTIFDNIIHVLDFNDSDNNISYIPESIQCFIGYKSEIEGVDDNKLIISEIENISILYKNYTSYYHNSILLPDQFVNIKDIDGIYGEISLNLESIDTFRQTVNSSIYKSNLNIDDNQLDNDIKFIYTDFKISQKIKLKIFDDNIYSVNNNIEFEIYEIYEKSLIVKYLDRSFVDESNIDIILTVLPKEIINIDIYGQTEIEDIRYSTELNNSGNNINPSDIYIFKDYINDEGGIDWRYLNKKRKEMLMVRNDIFNYIGSYRSLINTINYFGYNDLELNEYFVNINENSANYQKLSKIEIPDIFDNNIIGWTDNYKFYQYPNKNYEYTNLFNLTYRFTDFDGNHKQTYSLDDALIKLSGLKKWIKNNILPITHKIKDITGRIDFISIDNNFNTSSSLISYKMNDYISPIDFNINELYILPIHSGSNVYNVRIDFLTQDKNNPIDYFTLEVKTYMTYNKWDIFKSYKLGEFVTYDNKVFKNVLIDNSLSSSSKVLNVNNNPILYYDVNKWDNKINYKDGDIFKYEKRIFKYSFKKIGVTYLPWESAIISCMEGDVDQTNGVDDNFYLDLLNIIGNSPSLPTYINLYLKSYKYSVNFNSCIDVMDIIKNNYSNNWCDILDKDSTLIESLSIDIVNLPDNQFMGDIISNKEDAKSIIFNTIKVYNDIHLFYKLKYKDISPIENIQLENPHFILYDDITKWEEVDLIPIQNIYEYRSGENMLLSYNLTIDSLIDPYIVVTTTSDNGYGQIKKITKSYEVRLNADILK